MKSVKILQINNVYPVKSTGRITESIHRALLEQGEDSYVLYGRGRQTGDINVRKVCSEWYAKFNVIEAAVSGTPYGGCFLSTKKVIRRIRKIDPDVVHLQCINEHFVNIYRLIEWLRDHRIPTVLTLHAEFMYTANCGHAFECGQWKTGCEHCPRAKEVNRSLFFDRTHESFQKMSRAFDGFDDSLRIVSVSPWLSERAQESPILKDKRHSVILNGLNSEIFHYQPDLRSRSYEYFGGQKILLHVTALFRNRENDPKGGEYIIQLAERLQSRNVRILVAGKHEITDKKLPENLVLLGEIADQRKLAEYYGIADLTVITSRRETYSMVCAESLCCGTPVAGFRAGAPEMISIPEYSEFVEFGDVEALQRCVEEWLLKADKLDKKQISETAVSKYDSRIMVEEYKAIYNELINSCSPERKEQHRR